MEDKILAEAWFLSWPLKILLHGKYMFPSSQRSQGM